MKRNSNTETKTEAAPATAPIAQTSELPASPESGTGEPTNEPKPPESPASPEAPAEPRESGTRQALRREFAEEDARQKALASHAGRCWLDVHLFMAESDLQNGPNGSGWKHNDTLRPAIAERAAFLRALVALLPAVEKTDEV